MANRECCYDDCTNAGTQCCRCCEHSFYLEDNYEPLMEDEEETEVDDD